MQRRPRRKARGSVSRELRSPYPGAITVGSVLAGAATALGVEKAALKEHKPAIKVRIGTLLDELLAAQAEAASAPAAATAEDASGSSSDGGDSDSDDDDDDSDGADDSDGDAAVDMAGAQEGADPGGLVSIGKDIEVYWKDDAKFYGCKIYGFEPDTGKYKLMYADGDEEEVVLKEEKWRWQKEKKDKLDARIAALDKAVTKRCVEEALRRRCCCCAASAAAAPATPAAATSYSTPRCYHHHYAH